MWPLTQDSGSNDGGDGTFYSLERKKEREKKVAAHRCHLCHWWATAAETRGFGVTDSKLARPYPTPAWHVSGCLRFGLSPEPQITDDPTAVVFASGRFNVYLPAAQGRFKTPEMLSEGAGSPEPRVVEPSVSL